MVEVYLDLRRAPAPRLDLRFFESDSEEFRDLLGDFLLLRSDHQNAVTIACHCADMIHVNQSDASSYKRGPLNEVS